MFDNDHKTDTSTDRPCEEIALSNYTPIWICLLDAIPRDNLHSLEDIFQGNYTRSILSYIEFIQRVFIPCESSPTVPTHSIAVDQTP